MLLPVGSAKNLLKCVTFLAWYEACDALIFYSFSSKSVIPHAMSDFPQDFNPEPVLPPITARPDQVERALKTRYQEAMTKLQGQEIELLIAILPDNNGSLYGLELELN